MNEKRKRALRVSLVDSVTDGRKECAEEEKEEEEEEGKGERSHLLGERMHSWTGCGRRRLVFSAKVSHPLWNSFSA